jgi:hypothetical protein
VNYANTSPRERRLATSQITESGKGSRIGENRFYVTNNVVDNTKFGSVLVQEVVLDTGNFLKRHYFCGKLFLIYWSKVRWY